MNTCLSSLPHHHPNDDSSSSSKWLGSSALFFFSAFFFGSNFLSIPSTNYNFEQERIYALYISILHTWIYANVRAFLVCQHRASRRATWHVFMPRNYGMLDVIYVLAYATLQCYTCMYDNIPLIAWAHGARACTHTHTHKRTCTHTNQPKTNTDAQSGGQYEVQFWVVKSRRSGSHSWQDLALEVTEAQAICIPEAYSATRGA